MEAEELNRLAEVGLGAGPIDREGEIAVDVQVTPGIDPETKGAPGDDLDPGTAAEERAERVERVGTEAISNDESQGWKMLTQETCLIGKRGTVQRAASSFAAIKNDGREPGRDGPVLVKGVQEPGEIIAVFLHSFAEPNLLHRARADLEDDRDLGVSGTDFGERRGIRPDHVELEGVNAGGRITDGAGEVMDHVLRHAIAIIAVVDVMEDAERAGGIVGALAWQGREDPGDGGWAWPNRPERRPFAGAEPSAGHDPDAKTEAEAWPTGRDEGGLHPHDLPVFSEIGDADVRRNRLAHAGLLGLEGETNAANVQENAALVKTSPLRPYDPYRRWRWA